ncbi:MAG: NAD-dependent epimerase/dehydratase family protein, partial [Anaerolineales bacterium]
VYASTAAPGIDESAPVGKLPDETVEQITGETYGPLKALCEQAVEAVMPGRALHVRAGLIVGPHDPTDRFTYWPHRVARGGEVLAPGDSHTLTQLVDVRDLAGWLVRMAEARQPGVYNATGPDYPLTLGQLLEACKTASGSDARLTWVSEGFLLASHAAPWTEIPLWIPASDPDAAGFSAFDCRRAIANGLTFRPLAETVRDTLAWDVPRPAEHEWRAGVKPEREAELLRAWHNSKIPSPKP